jgi:hypothetical protein
MHILVRRGFKSDVDSYFPSDGELIYCKDTREIYVNGKSLRKPNLCRQCIVSGPVNSLGVPSILEYVSPFLLKIKGGWIASFASKLDTYYVNITKNLYINLAQQQTNYIYLDRNINTGEVSLGITQDRPLYAPSKTILENYVGKVPIMTSDTTPYGISSCSGTHGGESAYLAFDGNDGTRWWATAYVSTAWIQYRCVTPFILKRMDMGIHNMGGFYTYGSNDGSNWTQLGLTTGFVSDTTSPRYCWNSSPIYFHGNNTPFSYYRVQATGVVIIYEPLIYTLQFCANEFPSTYFFNTTTMQMFDKSENPVLRVYIGEVTTNSNEISKIITYAYNGVFDSGWIPASYSAVNTIQHNLGVDDYTVNSYVGTELCKSPLNSFSAGRPGQTDWPYGVKINMTDRNTLTAAVYDSDVPSYALQNMRLICKRGW